MEYRIAVRGEARATRVPDQSPEEDHRRPRGCPGSAPPRLAFVALVVGLMTAGVVPDAAAQSAGIVLSVTTLAVDEGAASASYTVKLATQPTAEVQVSISGTSGTDLSVQPTSLTFTTSDWETSQTVTVTANADDDATHDNATLTHTASGGDYGSVTADLAVTVNDTTRMRLQTIVGAVGEGETMPIRATLPMTLDDDVTITVVVTPNGARNDEYELSTNRTLTIAAGATESTGEVIFTSLDDFMNTGTRYFNATLTADHSRVDADTEAFAVVDDDRNITQWRVTPSMIFEDGGQATLQAFKRRVHDHVVKMEVSLDPSDRATLSGSTLTFQPGALYATEYPTITAVDNAATEGDQTITITATVTEGRGVRMPPPLELTIVDDEGATPTVALRLTPPLVREGLVSTVTAEASHPLANEATITVSAAPGHADTLTSDYELSANTVLTIPAGGRHSRGTVAIATVDDALFGGRRREVTVSGTASGGGGVANPADETLTVLEDDSRILVAMIATPATIVEGETSTITLRALRPLPADATVTVSTYDEVEFSENTLLMIAQGQTESTGVVTVTALDDADGENEVVTLRGTPSDESAFIRVNLGAQLYVLDDDDADTLLSVSPVPQWLYEGETSTVLVELSQPHTDDLTVTIGVDETHANHTAATGTYTLSANRTLTIPAGSMRGTGTVTLTATDDEYFGPGSTREVGLAVESVTGTDAETIHVVRHGNWTIIDDESSPRLSLEVTPASISENGGQSTVTAKLNTKVRTATEVTITAAPVGTAVAGDFMQTGATVTIPADTKTSVGTVVITAVDDDVDGPDKNLIVTGAVADDPGEVWYPYAEGLMILDDDESGLTVNPPALTVGEGTSATYTVALTSEPPGTVDVTVSGTSGTDLKLSASSLTFTPSNWDVPQPVTVTADQDDDIEDDMELLTHTASRAEYGTFALPVTVVDDEGAAQHIRLEVDPDRVMENAGPTEVTVRAVLTAGARQSAATMVEVSVEEPGEQEDDYTVSPSMFQMQIPAGETSVERAFQLIPFDDGDDEPDRRIRVTGTNPDGIPVDETAVMLIDDDGGGGGGGTTRRIRLEVEPQEVREDAGATEVRVTARLTGGVRQSATVVEVTVEEREEEYGVSPATFEIEIPARERSAETTFVLTPVDDEVEDEDRRVAITGRNATNGIRVSATSLTILDDDAASQRIRLEATPERVLEDAGATEVRVRAVLAALRQSATVVEVTVEEREEKYGVSPATFDVEIPAGERSAEAPFVLTPVDDEKETADRQVAITGTNLADRIPVDATALTVLDDDQNRPPIFEQERYAFDLPENRSGRETPLLLGTVTALDPDDDGIRYALSAGDRERFIVSGNSGTVSYIGAGEDFESGPPRFELQVTAEDGEYDTQADVVVRVVDLPEAPEADDDRAETPEDTPTLIDVLANDSDPDGDRLRVSSVTEPEHGTATIASGGVRYAPDSNWYGTDRFTYTVSDADGLASTATVKVRVTPVNDPPEAVDDDAETLEDEAAMVDVLANDTDVDGDPLQVVSVTAAGHGATAIVAGGVRYSPDSNWYGTDRFTYTIADPGGLTSTATVTMTVLPVNDPPVAVGVIPDQVLEEGGAAVTLDLSPYFTDVDGDVLTYEAVSSDEAAVIMTVSGSTLTLSAVVTGTATVTVTASDVGGLTATQTFAVRVGDRLVRAVMTDTLAALGRGHLSSARLTIGRLLETRGGGMTRMMVAGQQWSPDAWDRMGAGSLQQSHELLFRAAQVQQRRSASDMLGTSADLRLQRPGALGILGGGFGGPGSGRDRLLQGTDVLLSFGQAGDAAEEGGPARWRVWGQGDLQSFRGVPTGTSDYGGDLRTAYVGVDARLSERWLAGVAVARSGGAGDWQVGSSNGRLTTGLTVLHPYLRWGDRETAVWALAGVGRGMAENVRTLNGRRGDSPLGLALGLVDARRRLARTAGGMEVDLRGEASWARLRTGAGEETVDGLEAGVRRVRTGVEVTLPLGSADGMRFAPFGALSTRHDGGAGQTGVGLEVAGGLRLSGGRVRIEAQGRMLALHTATDYEERGASVTVSVGGGHYEPGLTASLRPRWGAPGYGAESLWHDQFHAYNDAVGRNDGGFDGRVGYGLRVPGGRLLTPFGGYGQMGSARRMQIGANLGLAGLFGGDPNGPLQVEFMGERYVRPRAGLDHRFTLFGIVNLGAR